MRKLILFILFVFSYLGPVLAQPDPACPLRISLLTCAPGNELYSTFGHTAIRVQDPATGNDLVYNYGTFVFDEGFYMKFIRGNLLYSLSVETFQDFMEEYREDSRSVVEQQLQASCEEKRNLVKALEINSLPANRFYRYNFLFDNCTTRARDIMARNMAQGVTFRSILPAKVPSFRDLIHTYLDAGHEYWSKLGIDLLMGLPVDRKVTNQQAMFLPDYLLKGFDAATVGGNPLVSKPVTLLQMPSPIGKPSLFSPFFVFTLLAIIIIGLSFVNRKKVRDLLSYFDVAMFFLLGLAGLVMLLMWFATEHQVCRNNMNLLFALPSHLVMAFFIFRRTQGTRAYFRYCGITTALLLFFWWALPQQLNTDLVPLLLIILIRSWKLSQKEVYARKKVLISQ